MRVKTSTLCFWLVTLLVTVNLSFSQNGDRANRKWGHHDANKISSGFINYGMIGNWPSDPPPTEYPKGSGHTYLEGATPMIAAEIVDINGNTLHTIVTNFREFVDRSGQALPQTFEPLVMRYEQHDNGQCEALGDGRTRSGIRPDSPVAQR